RKDRPIAAGVRAAATAADARDAATQRDSSESDASIVEASAAASDGGVTHPLPSLRTLGPMLPRSLATTGTWCAYASASTPLAELKSVYGSATRSASSYSARFRSILT